ncbi:MAG: hypothetical protein RRZ92_03865 [Bacilli bacterium]
MSQITNLRKYKKALLSSKKKNVCLHDLSLMTGIMDERILDDCIVLEPLLRMSPDYNYRNLLEEIDVFIEENKAVKKPTKKKVKKIIECTSLEYIISKTVLPGGIINRSYTFNEDELKALRKIINKELKEFKK